MNVDPLAGRKSRHFWCIADNELTQVVGYECNGRDTDWFVQGRGTMFLGSLLFNVREEAVTALKKQLKTEIGLTEQKLRQLVQAHDRLV